jgi:hypothetical protein
MQEKGGEAIFQRGAEIYRSLNVELNQLIAHFIIIIIDIIS